MTRLSVQVGRLVLEPFTARDSLDLYAVRFHPTVRKFMSNPSLIPFKEHKAWCSKNLLEAPDMHLWLVRPAPGARAIGLTQLKFNASDGNAEIGVMFREPDMHQIASVLSGVITLYLAFTHFSCQWVTSYVVPKAQHAIDYNLGGGFSIYPSDRAEMVCLKLHRDVYLSNPFNCKVKSRIMPRMKITAVATED